MKIAPEHSEERVLDVHGETRPGGPDRLPRSLPAAHGGGGQGAVPHLLPDRGPSRLHAKRTWRPLRRFASRELAIHPEQVQLFTPTPSTISTLMYHTKRDPFSGRTLFVEKTAAGRERQKKILVAKKGLLRYGIPGLNQTTKEEESWARTRTSKKKPRRNLPKR